jgi:tRNA-modifying protein YgfZ
MTEGCALVDRSERGKLGLTGEDAKEFLSGQVTNDVCSLRAGEGLYAAFLTNKGKMRGDLRVLDTGEALLLDTERATLQALFDTLRRFSIGHAVQLHKRTVQEAQLSLVGPRARSVAGVEDLPAEEHTHRIARLGGAEVRVVATDVGLDVLCAAEDAGAVRGALLAAGATEVGEDEAEVVRVEHGRPRHGVDVDEGTIPQEAGLNERAVSFTKGCYVGQETVARLHYRGRPNRHLRGLLLSEPAASGTPIRAGEREVGRLGSVALSPRLGPIALALVRREVAPGDTVAVGEQGAIAEVVELPFARPAG